MEWKKLISAKRFGMEEFHEERQENRSEFQRDYDRLVFSAPFRRLQNKTQVFPLPGSVFVHNRLTHSLEVSCVGRSLGNDSAKAIISKNPQLSDTFLPEIGSIVSAACSTPPTPVITRSIPLAWSSPKRRTMSLARSVWRPVTACQYCPEVAVQAWRDKPSARR